MKRNRLIFRKVCNFNIFKTHSTYFPQILYLTGNFMKQLSAKFLLKKLSEIAKFEKSHNRFENFFFFLFFLSGFSFTDTDDSQDSRGRKGTIFYFTLPLPPAHEHSDIYLQLCMWDDYHIFLIAPLVFTRLLLLDEIYHLIKLPFDWLMMWH